MAQTPAPQSASRGSSRSPAPRCQLRAILFADAYGFSRTVRQDEESALRRIGREIEAIRQLVAAHDGVLCCYYGDGLLATFGSAHEAVRCAADIQDQTIEADGHIRLQFRVAVHIGDVFEIDGQAMGDSVNVASRIEALAEPGGIVVSRPVFDALRGLGDLRFRSIGTPYLKNIGADLELFRLIDNSGEPRRGFYYLRLIGSFALTGPDGAEFALPREGQALLAALAMADGYSRSRAWLQDTLWSGVPPGERPNRLDTALARLRCALGEASGDLLDIGDDKVGLVPGAVQSDLAQVLVQGWPQPGPMPDLLEGVGGAGPAFDAWLLRRRGLLRNALCLRTAETASKAVLSTARDAGPALAPPSQFAIGLLPASVEPRDGHAGFVADLLADGLIRTLSDVEMVGIHDYREGGGLSPDGGSAAPGPDLLLRFRAASAGDAVQVALTALRAEDRKLVWSHAVAADRRDFVGLAGEGCGGFVSYASDALLSALAAGRHLRDPAAHHAARMAVGAVHRLLTMTGPGLDRVEADLTAAYTANPKPVYLAWLAYMTVFRLGERYGVRDAAFEDQARGLAAKAVEGDPHNALVLSLVAHVHSYVFREFGYADDLLTRALCANPHRPACWDSAALLFSYTGRHAEAMNAALTARQLGRHSPYRHLFDGACCIAAAVNGRYAEAARFGESVMAVQPEFKAVLRYLAACYGLLGDIPRAEAAMRRLIALEPDLSAERLRDAAYPIPSRPIAEMIESGLSRVGLRHRG